MDGGFVLKIRVRNKNTVDTKKNEIGGGASSKTNGAHKMSAAKTIRNRKGRMFRNKKWFALRKETSSIDSAARHGYFRKVLGIVAENHHGFARAAAIATKGKIHRIGDDAKTRNSQGGKIGDSNGGGTVKIVDVSIADAAQTQMITRTNRMAIEKGVVFEKGHQGRHNIGRGIGGRAGRTTKQSATLGKRIGRVGRRRGQSTTHGADKIDGDRGIGFRNGRAHYL